MSNLNIDELSNDITSIKWDEIINTNSNVNEAFLSFYEIISLIVDKHIPLKKLSHKQASFSLKPWLTQVLQNSIRVKNHLYSKFLKTKSEIYHAQYKYYRI